MGLVKGQLPHFVSLVPCENLARHGPPRPLALLFQVRAAFDKLSSVHVPDLHLRELLVLPFRLVADRINFFKAELEEAVVVREVETLDCQAQLRLSRGASEGQRDLAEL